MLLKQGKKGEETGGKGRKIGEWKKMGRRRGWSNVYREIRYRPTVGYEISGGE